MPGFTSNVAQIAIADTTNCVLSTSGRVKCWGRGTEGELGNGGTSNSLTPVTVTGLTNAVAIVAGQRFECALTSLGGVKCWGFSGQGELGDGQDTVNRLTPVDVVGLTSGVTAIAAGSSSVCALLATGAVSCWGDFLLTHSISHVPEPVANLTNATALAAMSSAMCALTSTGSVVCWGVNSSGQLGNGTKVDSAPLVPVTVTGLTGVAAIAGGSQTACAMTVAGAARCWGDPVSVGSMVTGDSLTPTAVDGAGSRTTQIIGNESALFACAVIAGSLECWGYNNAGQLGDGTMDFKAGPVVVQGL